MKLVREYHGRILIAKFYKLEVPSTSDSFEAMLHLVEIVQSWRYVRHDSLRWKRVGEIGFSLR